MLRSYLKIALRNLWKGRGYAAVNVLGLASAFCICVFLFLTAYLHLTYDAFHRDADRLFQVYTVTNDPEKPIKSGSMPLPLAPALKADYPELEGVARVLGGSSLVKYGGKYFDKGITLTDPDFLTMFSFPLLQGDPKTALRELSSVVISQNTAKDVFGTANPMGKRIRLGPVDNLNEYIVTGLVADAPDNSTIRYDALIRIENAPNYSRDKDNWGVLAPVIYVKTSPQVNQATVEGRLKAFGQKYFPGRLAELRQKGARPNERGDVFALRLDKLTSIHFDRDSEDRKGTPVAVVYVLLGMAGFILLIACINFANLSIARSFTRAREVGVRKSLGALRSSLFVQIWGESTLICLMGFVVGGLLAYGLIPMFNATFGAKLNLASAFQPGFIGLILFVFVLVSSVAGGYPAGQMARFNTVDVLKGKVAQKRPGRLRNALIVTQFALSCLLICCTIIARQQTAHLRQCPVGFDKEQVISIPVGNQANGRQVLGRLRNKLAGDPAVLALTGADVNLGRGKDTKTIRSVLSFTYKGRPVATNWVAVDYDYLKTLNIKLLAGREFSPAYPADSANRLIISESMAKQLGETNPVGQLIGDDDDSTSVKSQVIGVVPDFQLYSLGDEAKPITLQLSPSEPIRYIFVRVSPQRLASSMDSTLR